MVVREVRVATVVFWALAQLEGLMVAEAILVGKEVEAVPAVNLEMVGGTVL